MKSTPGAPQILQFAKRNLQKSGKIGRGAESGAPAGRGSVARPAETSRLRQHVGVKLRALPARHRANLLSRQT